MGKGLPLWVQSAKSKASRDAFCCRTDRGSSVLMLSELFSCELIRSWTCGHAACLLSELCHVVAVLVGALKQGYDRTVLPFGGLGQSSWGFHVVFSVVCPKPVKILWGKVAGFYPRAASTSDPTKLLPF